jgi:hypothetical protein
MKSFSPKETEADYSLCGMSESNLHLHRDTGLSSTFLIIAVKSWNNGNSTNYLEMFTLLNEIMHLRHQAHMKYYCTQ